LAGQSTYSPKHQVRNDSARLVEDTLHPLRIAAREQYDCIIVKKLAPAIHQLG
jgi:hypothetical protein